MYELVPPGHSEAIPALFSIAKAHKPEEFEGTPLDAHDYASVLHIKKRQPKLMPEPLGNDFAVFEYVTNTFRQLLANGNICAYYCDERAEACPVQDHRYWATDVGFDDFLMGVYSPPLSLKFRKIYLQDDVLVRFLPKVADADSPARGRRGRKPKLNPENVHQAVFELMEMNGDFVPEDPEWNAQARLEEAVRQRFVAALEMSESALRSAIAPHLASWRKSKA